MNYNNKKWTYIVKTKAGILSETLVVVVVVVVLTNQRPLYLPSFVSFPSTNHLVVSADQNQNRTVTFASPVSVCPLPSPNTASLTLANTGHLYRQQTAS